MSRKTWDKTLQGLSVIVLAVLSVLMMYPIIWMFLTSFKSNAEIRINRTKIWPEAWTLEGYHKVLTEAPMGTWFLNSIIVTGITTLAILITSTLIGFVFAKYEFRLKKVLFVLLLATMMVPGQVTMVPRYLMVQKMGLFNSLGALIIQNIISAFGIYLSRQFIEDIPNSLCEAAKIDGANSWSIYWHVVLPNIRPAIGALGIFTALGIWNDYLNPLIMLNDIDKMTLPLALAIFTNQFSTDITTTMAAAAMIMVPIVIAFLLFQKQFVQSVALSGMK